VCKYCFFSDTRCPCCCSGSCLPLRAFYFFITVVKQANWQAYLYQRLPATLYICIHTWIVPATNWVCLPECVIPATIWVHLPHVSYTCHRLGTPTWCKLYLPPTGYIYLLKVSYSWTSWAVSRVFDVSYTCHQMGIPSGCDLYPPQPYIYLHWYTQLVEGIIHQLEISRSSTRYTYQIQSHHHRSQWPGNTPQWRQHGNEPWSPADNLKKKNLPPSKTLPSWFSYWQLIGSLESPVRVVLMTTKLNFLYRHELLMRIGSLTALSNDIRNLKSLQNQHTRELISAGE